MHHRPGYRVGMSTAFIRDQLFKPFQTTKASGIGIGAYRRTNMFRNWGQSDRSERSGCRNLLRDQVAHCRERSECR